MTIQESINRNNQIIDLLASGLTIKEVAQQLNISPKTVDVRLDKMRKRRGCNSTTQLVCLIREERIIHK